MLSLFWLGAVFTAYLGYKLHDWWIPVAVACVVAAGQLALLQMTAGGGPIAQLIGFGLMDLVMFYATFGIGRGIGQRLQQRRKGVR